MGTNNALPLNRSAVLYFIGLLASLWIPTTLTAQCVNTYLRCVFFPLNGNFDDLYLKNYLVLPGTCINIHKHGDYINDFKYLGLSISFSEIFIFINFMKNFHSSNTFSTCIHFAVLI